MSVTSAPVTRKDIGDRQQNGDDQQPRRRGSQPTQSTGGTNQSSSGVSSLASSGRSKPISSPQKSSAEPVRSSHRMLDVQHSIDLHRGSLDSAPLSSSHQNNHQQNFYRQESFPRDDFMGFAREVPSQYHDVNLISSVQVTPRPKPRSFPRTNPAYVGVPKREGFSSYKKVNTEQSQPAMAVYNQRFYDASPTSLTYSEPSSFLSSSLQSGKHLHSDSSGWSLSGRHERSDSDTSHSSFGLNRLHQFDQMTDSQVSCSSLCSKSQKDMQSDNSSQGSVRGINDSHSSQGSMRSAQELRDSNAASNRNQSSFGRASADHFKSGSGGGSNGGQTSISSSTLPPQSSAFSSAKSENDSEYANLPLVMRLETMAGGGGKLLVMPEAPPLARPYAQVTLGSLGSDGLKSGDSVCSSDSLLIPTDTPAKHDTPGSVRSQSSQNSYNIHISEGIIEFLL